MSAAFVEIFMIGVHFGNDIVRVSFRMNYAFIMNGYFGIFFVKEFIAYILAGVTAGFVAQRPHNDARSASVSVIHPLDSVKISRRPGYIFADEVEIIVRLAAAAVSFDIGFIHHIEPV